MKSHLTPEFRKAFASLPSPVQTTARKNYRIWLRNPAHPSLQFKRISIRDSVFSIRIGIAWRALGVQREDAIIWFWIGSHGKYNRLLRSLKAK